jgi:hypothetical protein
MLLCGFALSACSSAGSAPTPSPSRAAPAAVPPVGLPPGPLRDLVPAASDLPPGVVPVVAGSGPRDVATVAGYSADPTQARRLLLAHGFRAAYVAQYADPASGAVLSVVVARFATVAGATQDLDGDLAASTGSPVPAPRIGDQSQVRAQPLRQASHPGRLVTVRFRRAATTWLVAYGAAPSADPQVALGIARALAAR